MDISTIAPMVTNLGFSVVMCFMLWSYVQKLNDTILQITETHKTEVDGLKGMINSNTVALTELRDAINNMGKTK